MKWNNLSNNYESKIEDFKKKNPYERLEVPVGASIAEVKKAYRKKVSLYHPDRADDFMSKYGEEMVKLLNQALEAIEKVSKK